MLLPSEVYDVQDSSEQMLSMCVAGEGVSGSVGAATSSKELVVCSS